MNPADELAAGLRARAARLRKWAALLRQHPRCALGFHKLARLSGDCLECGKNLTDEEPRR